MANASKGHSKKKTHKPQVRNTPARTEAELKKATKKVQRRVAEVKPFKSAWFFVPLLASLVVSPALFMLMIALGILVLLVGLCLKETDKMRGQLIAAGIGAVVGSLPWFVYWLLGTIGVIG